MLRAGPPIRRKPYAASKRVTTPVSACYGAREPSIPGGRSLRAINVLGTRALLRAACAQGGVSELAARLSGKPALLSWATLRVMRQERDRTRLDHATSERELAPRFRPIDETLRDEIAYFRAHAVLPAAPPPATAPLARAHAA